MTKTVAVGMLRAANNGSDLLNILEVIAADMCGFDYIESPQLESALGIPTSEEIAF